MVFNSLTFVVFFAVVLALHTYLPIRWTGKKVVLLLASYAFYSAWNPPFVILLWISTVIDWYAVIMLCSSGSWRMTMPAMAPCGSWNKSSRSFWRASR